MNNKLSSFLNMSRWLAAFFVVVSHVRHIIFVDYGDVENKNFFLKALYAATSLGHESVVVFFVLSGYLVGALTYEKWKFKGPRLSDYALARISRIYTVLIPALLVGLIFDASGIEFFNTSNIYYFPSNYHILSLTDHIEMSINIKTFISNLFMMQGILTGYLGSNGPLWSLSYEWWYYCLFALIAAALTDSRSRRFVFAILACMMVAVLPVKILLWGAIWGLGLVAHRWIGSRVWRPHPMVGIGLFLLSVAVASATHGTEGGGQEVMLAEFGRDMALGVMYTIALVSYSRANAQIPFPEMHVRMANFSYSTYLIHFPAMIFIVAMGSELFGWDFRIQPNFFGISYFILTTFILYVFCFAFWSVAERHTGFVRSKLDIYMRRKGARA